jgi:hypothetical protein
MFQGKKLKVLREEPLSELYFWKQIKESSSGTITTKTFTAIKTSAIMAEVADRGCSGLHNPDTSIGSNHRGEETPQHGESSTEDNGDAGATIIDRQ